MGKHYENLAMAAAWKTMMNLPQTETNGGQPGAVTIGTRSQVCGTKRKGQLEILQA